MYAVPKLASFGQKLVKNYDLFRYNHILVRHGWMSSNFIQRNCLPVHSFTWDFYSTNSDSMYKKTKYSYAWIAVVCSAGIMSLFSILYANRKKLRSLSIRFESGSLISNGSLAVFKQVPEVIQLSSLISSASCTATAKSAGDEIVGLPTYTADDIASHDSFEKRIWVCYKSGVYDITDFVAKHPGGEKILMAAGGALEPFWELFAVHKSAQVLQMLEEYRIGNLCKEDRGMHLEGTNDPFASEPRRHPILKPSSKKPFNAEPPPELLVENFITPNEIFFVRNHLPVPEVDPQEYELEICGIGIETIYLKLEDIKTKFKKHTVTTTIQCAGNRRSELNKVKEVKGLNWNSAAISTAQWSGAKLIDVLKYCKVKFDDPKIQHIQFEGLDTDPANVPYGASIPSDKGLDPKADVLLAYEMNGEELPSDHGYPLRVVVPGIVGARNVKWLGRIVVSEEESNSHWQKNDYKGFSPSTTWENVDFKSMPAIQELPVNSAICKPSDKSIVQLDNGFITAAGYAWSGGGKKIIRVDVSVDDGKTWHVASLKQDDSPLYRSWAWTLWQITVPVPLEYQKSGSEFQIICKAVDASYNVQPDTFPPIWNLRGVLGNAWHRINVKVK